MSVAETDLQMRISSYKEIIKEAGANKHRYLKIKVKAKGKADRRTFLNKEEWASLIFDKIGVAVEEVQGIYVYRHSNRTQILDRDLPQTGIQCKQVSVQYL